LSASQNSKKRTKSKNRRRIQLARILHGTWKSRAICGLVVSILFGVVLGCLPGAGCSGTDSDAEYRKAEQFWQRKMHGLAAQSYEHFASQQPKHPKAAQSLYKAGFIYAYYLTDYPRAIQLFHRLIALYPESPFCLEAHRCLAENYATRLRQYPQAIAQYLRVVDLEREAGRDVSPSLYEVGRCYFLMGDTNQAVEVYGRICREAPKGEYADSAAYQIGFTHFLQEDWETAEKDFRFLLEQYPESEWTFDGLLHLSRCLKQLDRQQESKKVLLELRKRFPEKADTIETKEAG
jgi:TolA-binding protein